MSDVLIIPVADLVAYLYGALAIGFAGGYGALMWRLRG